MIKPRLTAVLSLTAVFAVATCASAHFRVIVEHSNQPYERQRTYSSPVAGKEPRSLMNTGMAMSGWTECGPGPRLGLVAISDNDGVRPPVMYNVTDAADTAYPADLVLHWVYWTDAGKYGVSGSIVGQTFVATGDNLSGLGIRMAGDVKGYVLSVHQGGVDGKRLGPAKEFSGGQSGWNYVRWLPDEIKTVRGSTYAVRIASKNGSLATPFIDSRGDVYPKGSAIFDGKEFKDRDLSLLIAMEDDGFVRHAPVKAMDDAGWQNAADGYHFVARGENALLGCLRVRMDYPGTAEIHGRVVKAVFYTASIHEDKKGGKQVGSSTSSLSVGSPVEGGSEVHEYETPALWGPDDARLVPGGRYVVRLQVQKVHAEDSKLEPLPAGAQVGGFIYGELKANSHPSVFDVKLGEVGSDSIEVVWRKGNKCRSYVEFGPMGGSIEGSAPELGGGKAVVAHLKANTAYQFRVVSAIEGGYTYRSPWYLAATKKQDGSDADVKLPTAEDEAPPQRIFLPTAPGPIYAR